MENRDISELEEMALGAELARQLCHDFSNFLYNLFLSFEIAKASPGSVKATDWDSVKAYGDRIVQLLCTGPGGEGPCGSATKLHVWQNQTSVFQDVAAYDGGDQVIACGKVKKCRAVGDGGGGSNVRHARRGNAIAAEAAVSGANKPLLG